VPYADADGQTIVMLRNKAGDRGVKLEYDTRTLPYFTLWKNTDTEKEGYVTGLEPGTGYAYTRAIEREGGRVPTLPPGESRTFRLNYTILSTAEDVSEATQEISDIQGQQETAIDAKPTAAE
jgi:galactose mutarotase-like enzyme